MSLNHISPRFPHILSETRSEDQHIQSPLDIRKKHSPNRRPAVLRLALRLLLIACPSSSPFSAFNPSAHFPHLVLAPFVNSREFFRHVPSRELGVPYVVTMVSSQETLGDPSKLEGSCVGTGKVVFSAYRRLRRRTLPDIEEILWRPALRIGGLAMCATPTLPYLTHHTRDSPFVVEHISCSVRPVWHGVNKGIVYRCGKSRWKLPAK